VVGWVLAVGSLLVDSLDLPSAEGPMSLADSHLPMAGTEPSIVRPMLTSGVHRSVVGRPAIGWKVPWLCTLDQTTRVTGTC
jgi:hypothetical protein